MAAFDRFKRATAGAAISTELWAQRTVVVAALPTRRGPSDHVPAVLDDHGIFRGICGAQDCRFLGTGRDTAAQALGDARRHTTQRNRVQGHR